MVKMWDFFSGKSPFKEQAIEMARNTGLKSSSQELLGPFSEITNAIIDAVWSAIFPSAGTNTLHWPYLLGMVLLAMLLWLVRRGRGAKDAGGAEKHMGFMEYILPRSIYTHISAKVDVGLYLIDNALLPVWYLLFLTSLAPFTERVTIGALQFVFGGSPEIEKTGLMLGLYGFLSFLLSDFVFFYTHYIMHKTRIGWAMHQVHHSAEVLTPLTRYREHFLVAPLWAGGLIWSVAFMGGIFTYLFGAPMTAAAVVGVTATSFLYGAVSNLRHHHVSFRFPAWLERWVQSPGMHHTHHSYLEKHWDTNLGLVLSVWDRMFGTLYLAERYEETPWGLSPEQQAKYTTLSQNLITPIREVGDIIRGKS